MTALPQNCERSCSYQPMADNKTELVVLTGGPGAGKTAVLELIRKILCEHVVILPEAASILFSGGFWRLDSLSAKKAAQRAIYHVQEEMQQIVLNENKWTMGLCDRGTLDCYAYWPGTGTEFFEALGTTREKEFQKYKAVIHLRTPEAQSTEEDFLIDEKIYQIWRHHPNYCMIESTDNFIEKVHEAALRIESFTPGTCREHFNELLENNIQ